MHSCPFAGRDRDGCERELEGIVAFHAVRYGQFKHDTTKLNSLSQFLSIACGV